MFSGVGPVNDIELKTGQIISIFENKGMRLVCESGSLWVTEEGRSQDVVLYQGQNFELGGRGLVVVQALSDAHLVEDFPEKRTAA